MIIISADSVFRILFILRGLFPCFPVKLSLFSFLGPLLFPLSSTIVHKFLGEKNRFQLAELVVVKDKNRFPLAELELWKFPLAEPVIMKEKTLSTCGTCCNERKTSFHLRNLM